MIESYKKRCPTLTYRRVYAYPEYRLGWPGALSAKNDSEVLLNFRFSGDLMSPNRMFDPNAKLPGNGTIATNRTPDNDTVGIHAGAERRI